MSLGISPAEFVQVLDGMLPPPDFSEMLRNGAQSYLVLSHSFDGPDEFRQRWMEKLDGLSQNMLELAAQIDKIRASLSGTH